MHIDKPSLKFQLFNPKFRKDQSLKPSQNFKMKTQTQGLTDSSGRGGRICMYVHMESSVPCMVSARSFCPAGILKARLPDNCRPPLYLSHISSGQCSHLASRGVRVVPYPAITRNQIWLAEKKASVVLQWLSVFAALSSLALSHSRSRGEIFWATSRTEEANGIGSLAVRRTTLKH